MPGNLCRKPRGQKTETNQLLKVLVYDRPISIDGLRWRDLQLWWSETNQITDSEEAKKTLYQRLCESLPANSPPQALLFDAFYRGFGPAVPNLPALLPEVWLHWDPKTVKERGPQALLRFRMDFLLGGRCGGYRRRICFVESAGSSPVVARKKQVHAIDFPADSRQWRAGRNSRAGLQPFYGTQWSPRGVDRYRRPTLAGRSRRIAVRHTRLPPAGTAEHQADAPTARVVKWSCRRL